MDGNATTPGLISGGLDPTDPLFFQINFLLPSQILTKRLLVVFSTWVLYEMVITYNQSLELFWKQKWSISKVLFFINRYDGVFVMLCWIGFVGAFLLILVLSLALLMRVRALWYHSRFIINLSTALFVINLLSFVSVLAYMYSTAIIAPYEKPFTGCSLTPTFSQIYIIFITSIAFETCIITLTFVRSYPLSRRQETKFPLSTVLLTDGLIYFLAILASQIASLIINVIGDLSLILPVTLSYPALAIIAVACNRLFIRLQTVLLVQRGYTTADEGVSANVWTNSSNATSTTAGRGYGYGGRKRRVRDPLSTDFSNIGLTQFSRKDVQVPDIGQEPQQLDTNAEV
ncbi:hypothetical protein CPB86DRAFT_249086 [Serendipita vermifera]|nr:hypothetical protein CPB86DRAFT_249086 [Serendipita vermifera]